MSECDDSSILYHRCNDVAILPMPGTWMIMLVATAKSDDDAGVVSICNYSRHPTYI